VNRSRREHQIPVLLEHSIDVARVTSKKGKVGSIGGNSLVVSVPWDNTGADGLKQTRHLPRS
jgi:hypothetical protein